MPHESDAGHTPEHTVHYHTPLPEQHLSTKKRWASQSCTIKMQKNTPASTVLALFQYTRHHFRGSTTPGPTLNQATYRMYLFLDHPPPPLLTPYLPLLSPPASPGTHPLVYLQLPAHHLALCLWYDRLRRGGEINLDESNLEITWLRARASSGWTDRAPKPSCTPPVVV